MSLEYKVLMALELISEEQLNELGRLNWQLCSIAQWNGVWYFYLRREKGS
jgi:hypothetical protein